MDSNHFLRARARPARAPLRAAVGCAAVNAVLLIVQCRLLASVAEDVVFGGRGLEAVWPRLWPVTAVIAARAVLAWAAEAVAAVAAGRVKQSVRQELLGHLMALGPVGLAGDRPGELAALMVEGVETLEGYYARFLPAMANVALIPVIILAVVLPADWLSGLILAATAPLIPLFMILIGKGAERLNQRQWARLARMSAHFLEIMQGLTTLKLFNAGKREAEAVARMSEDYRLATMSVLRVAFLSALALEFLATIGVALVAVLIGFRLLSGDMAFERGFFILLLAPEFYLPLRSLGGHYHARMEAAATAERMAALMNRSPLTPAPAPASTMAGRRAEPAPHAPAVTFDSVHLSYADGRKGLDGAAFTLPSGRFTALVGPSGAGKSSVVNLLLGFAAPTAGRILIDGLPLAAMDAGDWRSRIAWAPQRPYLFRGSIADNIRMGADADEAALIRAARLTGAHDIIAALPGGYDYRIGENGGGLSGGQARLLALTRAALRDAPLLILDEPTASLDRDGESRFAEGLAPLRAGRTLLAVAHRLETVRAADLVLVMNRGRIVEQGRHDALLAQDGLYAALLRNGAPLIGETAP